MWAAMVTVLIGLWIMVSPELTVFERSAAINHFIAGPLAVTIGVIAIWEVNRAARYLNTVLGIWLVLSPLLLSYTIAANSWNSIVSGTLIIIFSLVKGKTKYAYGGGWAVLFNADQTFFKNKVVAYELKQN